MTTAIIGTGGIGSAIARQLASGGESLQLSSADKESARKLAAAIGEAPRVDSRLGTARLAGFPFLERVTCRGRSMMSE